METEASSISSRRPLAVLSLVLLVASGACGGGNTNRFAGLSAEELFGMATERFEAGDHGEAIQMLDRILVSYGDWSGVPDARLMLGDVYSRGWRRIPTGIRDTHRRRSQAAGMW